MNIKIPYVKSFEDYHEIGDKLSFIKEIIPSIKACEVGFDGVYWGLFYIDKMPSKEEILQLLKKKGFPTKECIETQKNFFEPKYIH
jgi:hypothetical protein